MLTTLVSRTMRVLILAGVLFAFGNGARAAEPAWTAWGSIGGLEAGWKIDGMRVWHSAPMVNPKGCKVVNYGYWIDPSDPGHSLFQTVLLTAFMNKREVSLLLDGDVCAYDTPKIISVKIR